MVLGDDIDNETVIDQFDVGTTLYGKEKSPFYFSPRNVFVMHNTKRGMTSFLAQFVVAVWFLVECGAPINDFVYPFRPLSHYNLHHVLVTQSITSNESIFNMLLKTVVLQIVYDCHATLSIFGVGFIGSRFCHHNYFLVRIFLRHL